MAPRAAHRLTAADRDLLIGLNAELELTRSAVCSLALHLHDWRDVTSGRHLAELSRTWGVPEEQMLKAVRARERAEHLSRREVDRAARFGVRLITWLDAEYPAALRALDLPPPVLYCQGDVPPPPMAAIVGSRQADPYGLEVAELFAAHLASAGLTVVSGFARGIDAAAHRGAVGVEGGRTLAVLGCGLDLDYPRGHRRLRSQIARRGALVSEFPLGASPLARNFPVRNRIIAAFGLGTLVVQAAARSGSLITARLTLDLGREVWAVPGRVFDERAVGPNTLVRDGALLVQHPRDILESLPWTVRSRLPGQQTSISAHIPDQGSPDARLLASLPAGEALTAEAIARSCGQSIDEVLRRLLELELIGRVRRYPGPKYARR